MGIIVSQCESRRGSLKTNLNEILAEALLIVVVLIAITTAAVGLSCHAGSFSLYEKNL